MERGDPSTGMTAPAGGTSPRAPSGAIVVVALASGRLSLAGLVTHQLRPDARQLGEAYEGLLKRKEESLGVVIRWR